MSLASDTASQRAAWLVLTLGLAFAGIVAWTMLGPGPYDWHVAMPEAWQGALEALAVAAAVFLALNLTARRPALRWALLLLPLALYLRRHHVDGALLLALLYLEGLLAAGALVQALSRAETDDWLRNLIAGVAVMSLLLWLGQVAGWGLPRPQRLLAMLVLLPCLWWRRAALLTPHLLGRALALEGTSARAWAAVLIALFVVGFARTNHVADFDSLWYGLRPERVLLGERSVFEPLGLASPVHYFPKLYEVLLLPLSATREHSVVQGATVCFGALLALLAHRMLRQFGVAPVPALAGVATIWTIPALASSALGAKPDVFVALMVVAMVWFGGRVAGGQRAAFAWVLSCATLAVSAKLLAFPYVGAAGLACLLALRSPGTVGARDRAGPVVLAFSVAVAGFVCARTWLLAGMPTIGPEQLVALWRALGMELRPPVGTLVWVGPQDWGALPSILIGWVFDPARLSHIQLTWPGNVWLWLLLLVWIARPVGARPPTLWIERVLLWSVPLAGLMILLGVGFMNPGGDGNYFIAPVVLATVGALVLAWQRCDRPRLRPALLSALGATVALQFAIAFVNAGWGLGTRPWDLDFSRSNRDSPGERQRVLLHSQLQGVELFLRGREPMRLTGSLDAQIAARLAARYENVADVRFAHMDRPDDAATLRMLLGCGGVEAIVLQHDRSQHDPRVAAAFLEWAYSLPSTRDLYRDGHWRVVDLRGLMGACPAP
jgi:hypothetical protein